MQVQTLSHALEQHLDMCEQMSGEKSGSSRDLIQKNKNISNISVLTDSLSKFQLFRKRFISHDDQIIGSKSGSMLI